MWVVYGVLIFVANTIRFLGLETSPPGFYIDEAIGAGNVLCLKETGRDFFGSSLSLFHRVYENGFQSSPYLIGEIIWTSVFGDSIASFRAFAGAVTTGAILGLMALIFEITKDKKQTLVVGLLASILPWSFQFSRISWDAPLGPLFLIWGLYFVYRFTSKLSNWTAFFAGLLLAIAGYTYSPMRLQVAAMVFLLPGIELKRKIKIAAVFGVFCIPPALMYLNPEFSLRAKLLGITSTYPGNPYRDDSWIELFFDYLKQVFWHLRPEFLLFKGDHNLRHSIQSFGELDALTALGIVLIAPIYFIRRLRNYFSWAESNRLLVKLSILGIFAGITPAALTWEGVPHAIRSLGAWPFFVVLGSTGLILIIQKLPKAAIAVSSLASIFFAVYLYQYFVVYPTISGAWFDETVVQMAQNGRYSRDYRPLPRSYFLNIYQHIHCDAAPRE